MRPISPTWPTKFKAKTGDKTLRLEIQCDIPLSHWSEFVYLMVIGQET